MAGARQNGGNAPDGLLQVGGDEHGGWCILEGSAATDGSRGSLQCGFSRRAGFQLTVKRPGGGGGRREVTEQMVGQGSLLRSGQNRWPGLLPGRVPGPWSLVSRVPGASPLLGDYWGPGWGDPVLPGVGEGRPGSREAG